MVCVKDSDVAGERWTQRRRNSVSLIGLARPSRRADAVGLLARLELLNLTAHVQLQVSDAGKVSATVAPVALLGPALLEVMV